MYHQKPEIKPFLAAHGCWPHHVQGRASPSSVLQLRRKGVWCRRYLEKCAAKAACPWARGSPEALDPARWRRLPRGVVQRPALSTGNPAKVYITVSQDAWQERFAKYFYAYFCPTQRISFQISFLANAWLSWDVLRLCQHRAVTLMEICPELLKDKVIQKRSGNTGLRGRCGNLNHWPHTSSHVQCSCY